MEERWPAGIVIAGFCGAVALLRALAPTFAFDWMSLLLVAIGAASWLAWLSMGHDARRLSAAPQHDEMPPTLPLTLAQQTDMLSARMEALSWPREAGGLFDAVDALARENAFTALCAARGTLALLLREACAAECGEREAVFALADAGRIAQEEAVALSELVDILGQTCALGAQALPPAHVSLLLTNTLLAMGRLSQLG